MGRASRDAALHVPMSGLLPRALLAFIALPGMVAFVVPWLLAPAGPLHPEGLIVVALGTASLLWCVREFYVMGKGTLGPWSPPERLVVTGLYRFTRNPMYVSVLTVLLGWALTFRSRQLAAYALGVMVLFSVRVVWFEEPWAARTFGDDWTRYKARVPRWLGRV